MTKKQRRELVDAHRLAITIELGQQICNSIRNDLIDYVQKKYLKEALDDPSSFYSDIDFVYEYNNDFIGVWIYDPRYIVLNGGYDDWWFKDETNTEFDLLISSQLSIFHLHHEEFLWFLMNYESEMARLKAKVDRYVDKACKTSHKTRFAEEGDISLF